MKTLQCREVTCHCKRDLGVTDRFGSCRQGLSEANLRVLTPSDVVQLVMLPLCKIPGMDAGYVQALLSQHALGLKQAGVPVPPVSDMLMLEAMAAQVRATSMGMRLAACLRCRHVHKLCIACSAGLTCMARTV